MKKVTFNTTDGLLLTGIWHLPQKPTGKVIILAHGLSVDKDEMGTFVVLSEYLQDHGFAVFRFDFRGRGESEGNSVDMTLTTEQRDLAAAVNFVVKNGYKQIGLLGASFGGGHAVFYTAKHQIKLKALCLWNPVLNYDHTFLNPYLPWIIDRKGHMKKDFQEKGWSTYKGSTFMIGKKLFDEMENNFPHVALKKITIPTVIIHGDKDTHVPYDDSKEYVTNLKNGQFITVENSDHGFHKNPYKEKAIQASLAFFKENL